MGPFEFESVEQQEPSPIQAQIAKYYGYISEVNDSLMKDIRRSELFGKEEDVEHYYNVMNDYHYFISLMVVIALERANDLHNSRFFGENAKRGFGSDFGGDFYREKYHLDCIRKHFSCGKYGAESMAAIVKSFNDIEIYLYEEESILGVGVMVIEGKPGNENQIF